MEAVSEVRASRPSVERAGEAYCIVAAAAEEGSGGGTEEKAARDRAHGRRALGRFFRGHPA